MRYQPLSVDLSGRVALVTGANSGMGKATANELARMGAEVVLACRSTDRGEAARQEIVRSTGTTAVSVMEVDLSSLASVRAFAAAVAVHFPKLDVLVNNAAASLQTRELTSEGFERHWATNVLGPYLLTTLVLPPSGPAATGESSPSRRLRRVASTSPTPSTSTGAIAASAPIAPPSRRAECSPGRWPTASRTTP